MNSDARTSRTGARRIVVASGKGGTGKTLLAVHLAVYWARSRKAPVTYVDADVEEPNGHLFLRPRPLGERRFTVQVPSTVPGRCDGCGACQEACAWNALLALPDRVMLLPELCHSCGGCIRACPLRALEEVPREIGEILDGRVQVDADSAPEDHFLRVVTGRLDVGEARSAPLVEQVARAGEQCPPAREGEIRIVDAPPGTSCSPMAAIEGADLAVLVTEPTPFGLHDLKQAAGMTRALSTPTVAVINRSDLGGADVDSWLEAEGIPVLGHIPFDRKIAEAYAAGRLLEDHPAIRSILDAILQEAERRGVPGDGRGEEGAS